MESVLFNFYCFPMAVFQSPFFCGRNALFGYCNVKRKVPANGSEYSKRCRLVKYLFASLSIGLPSLFNTKSAGRHCLYKQVQQLFKLAGKFSRFNPLGM